MKPYFLKNNIDTNEKENFEADLIIDNIRRGKILAFIVIGFETLYLMIDILASILKVDSRFAFNKYLFMYLAMILINVIYLLTIRSINHIRKITKDYIKKLDTAMIVYITFVMSWGSIISLMDQKLYGQLMTFMVNMIVCSVIYLLDNRKIIIPYSISIFILIIGLPYFQSSKDILIGHYVNLFAFIIISWLTSRLIYYQYCENYTGKILLNKSKLLLEKKMEENRRMNLKLAMANNQLKELALLDELTGIPNRRSFRDFIDRSFQNYVNEGSTLSIIMFDIDFFKQFNDFYGHEEGDRILVAVANQVNSIVEDASEFFVRWGGDEFIFAAFNRNIEGISEKANAISTKVSDLKIPHENSPVNSYITVSLGTCTMQITDKKVINKVIRLADQALYLAKKSGRNCVKTLYAGDIAAE